MSKKKTTKRAPAAVKSQPDIIKATSDMLAAKEILAKAEAVQAQANKRVADAVTGLNKAQRAFDQTITMIKGDAPALSAWFADKSR